MNIFLLITFLLVSCTGIPKGIDAVDQFDINRYLGTWYEIARLDHRFERGLDNISATYSSREDGGIDVMNKGWSSEDHEWKLAQGRGYPIENADIGRFKVSFLGPFYSSYNIIALDKINYSYAMVTGPNKSYFWILSRTPQMDKETLQALLQKARNYGFETDRLIYPSHGDHSVN